MRDIFTEIWQTARRNKLRTTLTGFAVAWGIFMIIVLLGAGNGLINATMKMSGDFLSNSMEVYGGMTSKPYAGLSEGRWINLNTKDLAATESEFKANIDDVGATYSMSSVVTNGENYMNLSITGVYPIHTKIVKRPLMYGRFINEIDQKESFKVVGIYKSSGDGENQAYSAYSTIKDIYGANSNDLGHLEFTFHGLPTEKANEDFEKTYRRRLNGNHQAHPEDERSIWIWNAFTQSMQMEQGIAIIHTFLWVVGLFTLLSGIVGVSNIMLITVKERTHEFGIRKAIGAKPWSILKLIIIESVIITTFFGYVGMLLGAGNGLINATMKMSGDFLSNSMEVYGGMTSKPYAGLSEGRWINLNGLDVCFEATMVMVIAGTIAGLIPAYKASRIRPIEALRAD